MDWHPALEAHKEVLAQRAGHMGERMARAWAISRDEMYGREAARPSLAAFVHEIEDLLAADTMTLSHEMMDLAQHALDTFDVDEGVQPDEWLVPEAFLYLPEPFVTEDAQHKHVCWRAALTRLVPDMLVERDGESEHVWGLRVIMYGLDSDPDDYPTPEHLIEQRSRLGLRWNYTHATSIPLEFMNKGKHMANEGDPRWTWLTFLRVVQRLMSERIIVRTETRPPRPQRRAAARVFTDRPDPLVTVIELRRPRTQEMAEGHRDVNWQGRWIVRGHFRKGHWRSVRTKTGAEDRWIKQTWVSAYEKGPENLDLIIRKRVWVWDR